jgi:hypothetical protein
MAIVVDRPRARLDEVGLRVVVEEEAGHVVLDRVGQATHLTGHRQCAVALGTHLRKATRLVLRGHHDHVGAGQQPVLLLHREVSLHADAAGDQRPQLLEDVDVALLPLPQEDELRVERQETRRPQDEVESLLRHHARAHPDHRRPRALREPKNPLQGELVLLLGRQLGARVVVGDERVVGRIPVGVVDPVDDPHETLAHRHEGIVQAEAAFLRAQLPCVGLTVVTASAQAMPPFSMFILPYHSNM